MKTLLVVWYTVPGKCVREEGRRERGREKGEGVGGRKRRNTYLLFGFSYRLVQP